MKKEIEEANIEAKQYKKDVNAYLKEISSLKKENVELKNAIKRYRKSIIEEINKYLMKLMRTL